jgi:hypothetical protein
VASDRVVERLCTGRRRWYSEFVPGEQLTAFACLSPLTSIAFCVAVCAQTFQTYGWSPKPPTPPNNCNQPEFGPLRQSCTAQTICDRTCPPDATTVTACVKCGSKCSYGCQYNQTISGTTGFCANCGFGYWGRSCFPCPGTGTGNGVCTRNGNCDPTTGLCACSQGWFGSACQVGFPPPAADVLI